MRQVLLGLVIFAVLVLAKGTGAQAHAPVSSLCDLQERMAQGERRAVRVEGVFLNGTDVRYLVVPGCSGRSTLIEFTLKTRRNWAKLLGMSSDFRQTIVIFEGDFLGPPVPDPKLPEGIRKVYHPGWDSNAATKMIVHTILSVKALPADHPCAPSKSDPVEKWPCFQHDPVPHREGGTEPVDGNLGPGSGGSPTATCKVVPSSVG